MSIPRLLLAAAWGLGLALVDRVPDAVAQETAPLVLRLSATPRPFSLGRTYVALSGPDAIFYNPANAGGGGFFVAGAIYSKTNRQVVFTNGTSFKGYSIAIFGNWLDYRTDGLVTRPGDLTLEGGPLAAQSLAGGVAVNRSIKAFRIGATAKYAEQRVGDAKGNGVVWDLGVARSIRSLSFGFAIRNMGDDMVIGLNSVNLPREWELGASSRSYPLTGLVNVMATASVVRDQEARKTHPGGGIELSFDDPVNGYMYRVRLGYRDTKKQGDPSLQPWTVGASFGKDQMMIDYGFEAYRGRGAVHRFGLRMGGYY